MTDTIQNLTIEQLQELLDEAEDEIFSGKRTSVTDEEFAYGMNEGDSLTLNEFYARENWAKILGERIDELNQGAVI